MGSENMTLKWDDFEKNAITSFKDLRDDDEFFDATIMCEQAKVRAHRVILSACSPKFREMFRCSSHHSPVVYLSGVREGDLVALLDFMYHGQVAVPEKDLEDFLKTAADLQVKGLSEVVGTEDASLEEDLQSMLNNRGGPAMKRMKMDQDASSSLSSPSTGLSLSMKQEPGAGQPRRVSTQDMLRSSSAESSQSALFPPSPAKQLPSSISLTAVPGSPERSTTAPRLANPHQFTPSSSNQTVNFHQAATPPQFTPSSINQTVNYHQAGSGVVPQLVTSSNPSQPMYAVRLPFQQPGQPPAQHLQAPDQRHQAPVQRHQAPVQRHQVPVQRHQVPVQPHQAQMSPPVLHLPESAPPYKHLLSAQNAIQTTVPSFQTTVAGFNPIVSQQLVSAGLSAQDIEGLIARHQQQTGQRVQLQTNQPQGQPQGDNGPGGRAQGAGPSADQELESLVDGYMEREGMNLKCKVCGKVVKQANKHTLISHIESVHLNTKLVCSYCHKEFKATNYLKQHLKRGPCAVAASLSNQ